MSIIAFPTIVRSAFSAWSFQVASNTQRFISPLNQYVQTAELPGARWVLSATFESVNRAEWRAFQAFLAALRGGSNRFMVTDLSHLTPTVGYTGTMVVNGSAQSGASLATSGWTGTMKAGDYVQYTITTSPLLTELRMVVADLTNAGGYAVLSLDNPMRGHPSDGSAIVTSSAACKMILADDNQAKWGYSQGFFSPNSVQAIEVFE